MIAIPRVLVLLATYGGRNFIDQQIASILWQADVTVHILVRDDGSTDGTVEACERWAARHPDAVTILRSSASTGSATGNFFSLLAGAPLDEYAYVALADQDDVWFPDKIGRAVAAMRAAGADGYSSDLLAFDERAHTAWIIGKAGSNADLDYLFQGASAGCTYVLSVAAARLVRDVMAPLSGDWPRALSHDWTIYAACRSRGLGWVRDSGSSIMYRQHSSNNYGARTGLPALRSRLQGVRDDWYRNHVLWLRRVVAMNPAEQAVFAAIDRGDRLWLARNAPRFRRSRRETRMLALTFLAGLF